MKKIVLDTNILISGVIASGYSAAILDAVRKGRFTMVTSAHLLEEFSDVISRRRIARKYPGAAQEAEALLDFFRSYASMAPGIPGPEKVSPDRDDDFVLACALDGGADCIVSGDPHLLGLKSYKGIPILTPREFVETAIE